MNKQRILYIGEINTRIEYLKGNVPSHWFYGAIEMEKEGHAVIWCQEKKGFFNDMKLIFKNKHDIIFIPNLNIQSHLILLILSMLKLYRKPIYAYLHREPPIGIGIKGLLYKLLLSGLQHIFFLSEKSMKNTINAGFINSAKCSTPNWGPDMGFYSKVKTYDNGWFVSTGKENRDFDVIVEAFRQSGAPLRIFTVANNYTSHYEYLNEKCKYISNIEVTIVENSSANYPMMLAEMAAARAIVCPIRQDKLNYCVGLSTIADAEGLGKPLIITHNPYHDAERVSDIGIAATTVEEWIEAIEVVQKHVEITPTRFNMTDAYLHMKTFMEL